jgi:hypothetical protein
MGRRKPAAAFSLFSFQDIVTSVTAILILVMLLLSVELVSRRRSEAAADPVVTRREMTSTVERLESQAATLREDLAARRSRGPARTVAMAERELARVREDLEASRRHLAESTVTRQAAAQLRIEKEALAAAHAGDAEEITRLEQESVERNARADMLEEANKKEVERQENRKREIADGERAGTELVYNLPPNFDRRAWLVELSRDGITALLLGNGRMERLGVDVGAGSRFAAWCGGLTPEGDYCLLLERPSAADQLRTDAEEGLKERGIPFGIELVGEAQTVRDGTMQAGANP